MKRQLIPPGEDMAFSKRSFQMLVRRQPVEKRSTASETDFQVLFVYYT